MNEQQRWTRNHGQALLSGFVLIGLTCLLAAFIYWVVTL